jgi:hypothetical protein
MNLQGVIKLHINCAVHEALRLSLDQDCTYLERKSQKHNVPVPNIKYYHFNPTCATINITSGYIVMNEITEFILHITHVS